MPDASRPWPRIAGAAAAGIVLALALGICCHPYDLCTELIAREAGVVVTDLDGEPLRARLAVEPDVAWVASGSA